MHRGLRTVAPLALVAAVLLVAAPPGPPASAATVGPDLERLQAELEQATGEAASLAGEVEAAAARAVGLRTALARAAEEQDAARARVGTRARQAYLALQATREDPLTRLVGGLAAPDLRRLAEAELSRRGAAAAVRAESALADAAGEHAAATAALEQRSAAYRGELAERAGRALQAQEAARTLLAAAQQAAAEHRARAAADRQRAGLAEAQARAAAFADTLAASRSRLDAASASVTRAMTPAQTRRSRDAAAREAPLVALVEAAGAGMPQGYRATGQVQRGVASWYGPGFVGKPTASGAPYDPERLTCAHRTLPLGTLVRVVRGPLAISCVVNDRGPFVGGRILDLSRAGSRTLGFDGVAEVAVEVLAPAL